MPADLQTIADPRFVLLAWAAGLALVAGLVSLSEVVGRGFTWLTAATAGVIGLAGVLAENAWWARIGAAALIIGVIWASNRPFAGAVFVLAGVAYLIEASFLGGWSLALTATLSLGGVTGEMLLGHWYLVQPGLSRSPLVEMVRWTGVLWLPEAALLLVPEGMVSVWNGTIDDGYAGMLGWFWAACVITTIGLLAATLIALREREYAAVMAATGLLYLAILTGFGIDLVGRATLG